MRNTRRAIRAANKVLNGEKEINAVPIIVMVVLSVIALIYGILK